MNCYQETLMMSSRRVLLFGERVSDKIAEFGGSWKFIITFGTIIIWIIFNAFLLTSKAFDPYPFILLNLVLSCLAALQAPVIMMSQNRQDKRSLKRRKRLSSKFKSGNGN